MPANRSTRTRTSSRKSRTSSQTRGPQKGKKKNVKKKQDNTKLFIGIGVGVFFLLFIIIAASTGGDQAPRGTSTLNADFLSVSQRKEIYSLYNQEYDAIEQDARAKMANLSTEDRRKQGPTISRIKSNQQAYLPEKMKNKFENKYIGITIQYIMKHVIEAGDAGKF
ncbi:MAG: hypothetical protein NE327_17820 [Lentisphaeraceae bacterium]|nr:hypothetical protein [Lentisphaeraceae bacterium]